ncbi:DUF5691 domain-containing protein [Smaragdicoccus niigatensis]|uniref:DUF5691 domain-containing protein n=1 Tax=Smaragdicoccus niigatensis TaxID=359359 RepID=UPI00035D36D2|nr:DUF5691 domain-containing protein [Smaragdicoccus niigatensis]
MTAPWTEEQVRALAPDSSSFSAARPLASRWRETGSHDLAVWGFCQGSGAKPYQTIVDVSGRAYKCSCPSRKFPCKHALSLLLLWSSGQVPPASAIPAFAGEWVEGRRAKADREAVPKTSNPATVDQRKARVAAGLAELDTWLTDQVRAGLAQSDRSFAAFEAIAARMVDAQAPGVAATLRSLFNAVVTKSHWPEILLREYGRLHLLVRAHRQLDDLPAATQSAVRAHVGYPMQAETVRTEPKVRDRWMSLGRKTTEENRLHTRRTWLFGRHTKRWAMLVEHSFGTATFSPEVPPPGTSVDADVHFYPGSAGLRVQWGERHSRPEPFTTIPAAGTIDEALTAHATALGADPWIRSWPALIADVVPVVRDPAWQLVARDGNALSLTSGAQAWQLLAISAGHPVTVIGDWTADGFEPVSAFSSGQVFNVNPERIATEAPARSQFAELVSVALVGTARRSPEHAHLDAPVREVLLGAGEPATRLLEAAALQYVFLRGGDVPGVGSCPVPAPDDERIPLPQTPARRLAWMLATKSAFLPEWFSAAAPFDYRLPAELCVQALWVAASDGKLREPLLRLAGPLGRWLAAQNPEWSSLTESGATEDVWLFGSPPERRGWFAALRGREPELARETLVASWAKESGPLKAELLDVLADGLSLADESLLESALDDRRADVRASASRLLSRLPGSAFADRMAIRLHRWVHVDTAGVLTVDLPAMVDDADRRDGLGDDRLRQVIAASPLSVWPQVRELPDRYRQSILDGWIDATIAQRDSRWGTALFGSHRPSELFGLLPPDEQIRRVQAADPKNLPLLLPALPHPWPDPVADHVLGLFARRARSTVRFFEAPERGLVSATSVHAPVSFAPHFAALAQTLSEPIWRQNIQRIADNLAERASMLEELK